MHAGIVHPMHAWATCAHTFMNQLANLCACATCADVHVHMLHVLQCMLHVLQLSTL